MLPPPLFDLQIAGLLCGEVLNHYYELKYVLKNRRTI